MKTQLYIPVFASTLLVSAALLFSVQPMFSKMILPLLGGTAQVWNTAMLFFQAMLLGGYAYAHLISKHLNFRMQALVHIMVLITCSLVLPLAIPEGWQERSDMDPTLWQLGMMSVAIGGPFFALAGSAPLFQRWFVRSGHKDADNPYFLYGASNLGSMASLLLYPVLIEPLADLQAQAYGWMLGYGFLVVLVVGCMYLVLEDSAAPGMPKRAAKAARTPARTAEDSTPWALRLKWLMLAFVPSSLMLGVTTYITSEVASMPLLWIVPLAIYVGTFILVFARRPLLDRRRINLAFGVVIVLWLAYSMLASIRDLGLLPIHLGVFAMAAYCCHTELAALRPKAEKLTEFYLMMSIGGALGGFFNAIIAPLVFIYPVEYALVLCFALMMRYSAGGVEDTQAAESRPLGLSMQALVLR